MLLGIKDDEQDSLLSFLIDDTVNMIMAYCHIDVLPRQLESLVPKIAADMYRAKGYGGSKSPEVVKSISEGERSVTYTETDNDKIFSNYYEIDDYTGKTEKTVLSEIKADVQPYSGGRAREQYGLDIECQMRMFCDMSDDVKVGNRVEYDGDIYDITYVQKWDSGLVAMLERSRLK